MREVNLNLHQSAILVMQEAIIFWRKARIPTRTEQKCVKKLEDLYEEWRHLQKSEYRKSSTQIEKNTHFLSKLDDVANANALDLMTNEEDRAFLFAQRQEGRTGSMLGIDQKTIKLEKTIEDRKQATNKRKDRARKEFEASSKFLV